MTTIDRAAMRRELEGDEGRVSHAYKCSEGYLTIGVGRLIDRRKGGRLRDSEIDFLLDNDIAEIEEDLMGRCAAYRALFKAGEQVRMRALLNMAFQMGVDGLLKFKNSLAYVERRQWAEAGSNMRLSLWFKQTPKRAERVIRMIETGQA